MLDKADHVLPTLGEVHPIITFAMSKRVDVQDQVSGSSVNLVIVEPVLAQARVEELHLGEVEITPVDLVLAFNMDKLVGLVDDLVLKDFFDNVFKRDNAFELVKLLARRSPSWMPRPDHRKVPNAIEVTCLEFL